MQLFGHGSTIGDEQSRTPFRLLSGAFLDATAGPIE